MAASVVRDRYVQKTGTGDEMDEYEKWEKDCKRIREQNAILLVQFADALKEQGLNKKTIDKHVSNIDFYINHFLLNEDPTEPENGLYSVSMFLGYWFIKKAMWANPSAIKNNASSLKKFYSFMLENGKIEQDDYQELKDTIKQEMPEWVATMQRYDDPDIEDMEDVWGI